MSRYNYYFTITAGRTGTAWLAKFIHENLQIESIHEPLDIYDFGTEMPDIKIMRAFNNFGNCEFVQDFWKKKLINLSLKESFSESNHTLAKCGLIENIHNTKFSSNSLFIILRRDKVKQCLSYIKRGDFFVNITIPWQWYLLPVYSNKIMPMNYFSNLKKYGIIFWYIFEIEVRQKCYLRLFKDKLNFLEVTLEEIITKSGAKTFLSNIGINTDPILPPKYNQNISLPDQDLINEVKEIYNSITIDTEEILNNYIKSGRRLS